MAVWTNWVHNSSATSATNSEVWAFWTTSATTTTNQQQAPVSLTPEQAALAQVAMEAANRRQAERDEKHKRAQERAEALLLSCLDPIQRENWEVNKKFFVKGSQGGLYCLEEGHISKCNSRLEKVVSYCIHPDVFLPFADLALAKKLMVEADEPGFLAIAHGTTLTPVPIPQPAAQAA